MPQGLRVRTLSYSPAQIEVEILTEGESEGLAASVEILGADGNSTAVSDVIISGGKGGSDGHYRLCKEA